jgi:hypothetical protein
VMKTYLKLCSDNWINNIAVVEIYRKSDELPPE